MSLLLERRRFLTSIVGLVAAPAIIRVADIMKISQQKIRYGYWIDFGHGAGLIKGSFSARDFEAASKHVHDYHGWGPWLASSIYRIDP